MYVKKLNENFENPCKNDKYVKYFFLYFPHSDVEESSALRYNYVQGGQTSAKHDEKKK